MTGKQEPVSVAIIGSCVTRDAFACAEASGYTIEHYSARTGLGSFLGPATRQLGADFDRIPSAFQRRVVRWDVEKFGRYWLRTNSPDVIVYDPIDERFALAVLPDDGVVTLSNEFGHLGIESGQYRRILPWSEEHFTRWRRGWATLLRLLDDAGLRDRLVVHLAYWGTTVEQTGDSPGRPEEIARANAWLARAEEVMRSSLPPDRFIRVPNALTVADGGHRWGVSPFHYVHPYYLHFLQELDRCVAAITGTAGAPSSVLAAEVDA
ncbi:DUF6270 domain-containing protein [Luteococcus sediminum]